MATITVETTKKKRKAGGNPDKTIPYRRKKGDPPLPGAGRPRLLRLPGVGFKGSSKLIGDAIRTHLGANVPKEVLEAVGLPVDGALTWAELYVQLQALSTVGLRHNPDHTTIREFREVTEGKLPEKAEMSGPNGQPLPAATPTFNVQFKTPPKEGETS